MVKRLLIIESSTKNFLDLFKDIKTIKITNEREEEIEEELEVDQASWEDINLSAYSDSGAIVDITPSKVPILGSKQFDYRTFKPDFLLIRNISYGLPTQNHKNLVYAFNYVNLPCINSLQAVISNFERPVMYAGLRSIATRLGYDKFPLIPQHFFPNYQQMRFTPEYPIVVKVGHVHAGYGKMLLKSHDDFNDLATILALHDDYCTVEKFINGAHDLRIQKIGNNYRAYRRTSASGWKTNVGSAILEDIPMTEKYKMWIDECSKLFGGMDILAIDIIVCADTGKEYILEMNDSSIGLGPQHEEEDMVKIRDLTIAKMQEHFSYSLGKNESMKGGYGRTMDSSSGLYKKLEVELINTENSKMELEQQLKKSKDRVAYLTEINRQWKVHTTNLFAKAGGLGFATGFTLAFAIAFFLRRKR